MYDKSMEASSEAEKRMHDLERSHMSAAEALENMYAPRLSHSYITSDVGFVFKYVGFRGIIVGIYIYNNVFPFSRCITAFEQCRRTEC
jgi:hypothetical protein